MSRHRESKGTFKKSWIVLCEDLSLLASLYVAHFIVWRALRTRRKEGKKRGMPTAEQPVGIDVRQLGREK